MPAPTSAPTPSAGTPSVPMQAWGMPIGQRLIRAKQLFDTLDPSTMSPDELQIHAALGQRLASEPAVQAYARGARAASGPVAPVSPDAFTTPRGPGALALTGRTLQGIGQGMGLPIPDRFTLHGLRDEIGSQLGFGDIPGHPSIPIGPAAHAAKALYQQTAGAGERAGTSLGEGDWKQAAAHALGTIPLVGAPLEEIASNAITSDRRPLTNAEQLHGAQAGGQFAGTVAFPAAVKYASRMPGVARTRAIVTARFPERLIGSISGSESRPAARAVMAREIGTAGAPDNLPVENFHQNVTNAWNEQGQAVSRMLAVDEAANPEKRIDAAPLLQTPYERRIAEVAKYARGENTAEAQIRALTDQAEARQRAAADAAGLKDWQPGQPLPMTPNQIHQFTRDWRASTRGGFERMEPTEQAAIQNLHEAIRQAVPTAAPEMQDYHDLSRYKEALDETVPRVQGSGILPPLVDTLAGATRRKAASSAAIKTRLAYALNEFAPDQYRYVGRFNPARLPAANPQALSGVSQNPVIQALPGAEAFTSSVSPSSSMPIPASAGGQVFFDPQTGIALPTPPLAHPSHDWSPIRGLSEPQMPEPQRYAGMPTHVAPSEGPPMPLGGESLPVHQAAADRATMRVARARAPRQSVLPPRSGASVQPSTGIQWNAGVESPRTWDVDSAATPAAVTRSRAAARLPKPLVPAAAPLPAEAFRVRPAASAASPYAELTDLFDRRNAVVRDVVEKDAEAKYAPREAGSMADETNAARAVRATAKPGTPNTATGNPGVPVRDAQMRTTVGTSVQQRLSAPKPPASAPQQSAIDAERYAATRGAYSTHVSKLDTMDTLPGEQYPVERFFDKSSKPDALAKGKAIYDSFQEWRNLMRARHGDTITLQRYGSERPERTLTHWHDAGDSDLKAHAKEGARERTLLTRQVPLADIVAAPGYGPGKLREYLVLNHNSPNAVDFANAPPAAMPKQLAVGASVDTQKGRGTITHSADNPRTGERVHFVATDAGRTVMVEPPTNASTNAANSSASGFSVGDQVRAKDATGRLFTGRVSEIGTLKRTGGLYLAVQTATGTRMFPVEKASKLSGSQK